MEATARAFGVKPQLAKWLVEWFADACIMCFTPAMQLVKQSKRRS
jgi:hypothetical protein